MSKAMRATSGALAVAAAMAIGIALPADAAVQGFTGPYAPATWSTTVTGNLAGASGGSAAINGGTLVLTGGNATSPDPANFTPACIGAVTGLAGPCQIGFTTTSLMNPFSFDWTYTTTDTAGPGSDLFGMLIDGVRFQLSDPGGAITQSGHQSVSALASFGWYVNCTDCIEGAATASITNFQAGAVPEPGTMALLGVGLMLAGRARRRDGGRAQGPAMR